MATLQGNSPVPFTPIKTVGDAISACGVPIEPATDQTAAKIALQLVGAIGQFQRGVDELESNATPFTRRRTEDYFGDAFLRLLQLAAGANVALDDIEVNAKPVPRSLISFHDSTTSAAARTDGGASVTEPDSRDATQPPSSTPGASPKGAFPLDLESAPFGSVIVPKLAPKVAPPHTYVDPAVHNRGRPAPFATAVETVATAPAATNRTIPAVQSGDSFSSSRTESPQQMSTEQFPFTTPARGETAPPASHLARVNVPPIYAPRGSPGIESPNRSQPSSARGSLLSAEGIKGCLRKTPRNANSGSPRPEDFATSSSSHQNPTSATGAAPVQMVQFADFPFVSSTSEVPHSFGNSGTISPSANAAAAAAAAVAVTIPAGSNGMVLPPPAAPHHPAPSVSSAKPTSVVHSPPALRSRDQSFVVNSGTTMWVTNTSRAAGTEGHQQHSRSNSNLRTPASPTGQPLFGLVDDRIFITSDDDMLDTLNAVTVMSIHSATASPGGQRLVPPRGARRGPSPRPASTPALSFQQLNQPGTHALPPQPYSPPSALRSTDGAAVPVPLPTRAIAQIPSKEDLDATMLSGPPQFGSDNSDAKPQHHEDDDDDVSSIGSGQPMNIQRQAQPVDSGSFALGSSAMESSGRDEKARGA